MIFTVPWDYISLSEKSLCKLNMINNDTQCPYFSLTYSWRSDSEQPGWEVETELHVHACKGINLYTLHVWKSLDE